ncbi:hypothetical protein KIN20_025317 [Parelaphostrongylus tenuis]|uniref:Uncharacterized protein n=1 Tax=Parelaphostrongylus tenuis TaxID=148309 RepID=A0AAD5MY98_PARTN|nr:hypothetical protein KIN20_025317 [Parelaphostrongylus tenuis]
MSLNIFLPSVMQQINSAFIVILGFKEGCRSSTHMIDVSELLLTQEVLQKPEEVRQRQVRTVRPMTQQLPAQFGHVHPVSLATCSLALSRSRRKLQRRRRDRA